MKKEKLAIEDIGLHERAAGFVAGARSAATRTGYQADWKRFDAWCALHDACALPATAETVALYLTDHAETLKPATLARHLVAISQIHQAGGHEPPTRATVVRKTISGIRRAMGTAQTQKAPLLVDELRAVIEQIPPDSLLGKRDRALLLLGFSGAFRRSELVGLNVGDLSACEEGLIVTVRRSKNDQEGRGQRIGIPFGKHKETCPVLAYRAWIAESGIQSGAVFRPVDRHGNVEGGRLTGHGAAYIIKRAVATANLDPSLYAGHSLRAGLATSAAKNGVPERKIMEQTRHTSEKMVRRYIRDADIFKNNAAGGVGL